MQRIGQLFGQGQGSAGGSGLRSGEQSPQAQGAAGAGLRKPNKLPGGKPLSKAVPERLAAYRGRTKRGRSETSGRGLLPALGRAHGRHAAASPVLAEYGKLCGIDWTHRGAQERIQAHHGHGGRPEVLALGGVRPGKLLGNMLQARQEPKVVDNNALLKRKLPGKLQQPTGGSEGTASRLPDLPAGHPHMNEHT